MSNVQQKKSNALIACFNASKLIMLSNLPFPEIPLSKRATKRMKQNGSKESRFVLIYIKVIRYHFPNTCIILKPNILLFQDTV